MSMEVGRDITDKVVLDEAALSRLSSQNPDSIEDAQPHPDAMVLRVQADFVGRNPGTQLH